MATKKPAKKTTKAAKKSVKKPVKKAVKAATKKSIKKSAPKKPVAKKAAKKVVKKAAPAKKAVKKPAPKKVVKKAAPPKKVEVKKSAAKRAVEAARSAVEKQANKVADKKAESKLEKKVETKAVKKVVAPEPKPEPPPKPLKPLPQDFLDEMREILLAERKEYEDQLESLTAEAEQLASEHEPGDVDFSEEGGEGDTLAIERERDLALSGQARTAIEDIDRALNKVTKKTYGYCENCRNPIPRARLKALPFAELCVDCKQGGLSRRL